MKQETIIDAIGNEAYKALQTNIGNFGIDHITRLDHVEMQRMFTNFHMTIKAWQREVNYIVAYHHGARDILLVNIRD